MPTQHEGGGRDLIIPCERLLGGAPSAYGSTGYEVVRDGWSVAVFRARRETNARGQLQPPTKEALAVAYADAQLFAAAPELLAAARALAAAVEGVRDDQVSVSMGLGRTAEERAERRRVLAGYIARYAEKVDDALEVIRPLLSQSEGRS